ncbi:MAG: polyphenol oxidase family protein [Deltaproteobacteria bacterium]|nr:polyphenol oxidase family protein [Deltaproteobacteria bacterium]MBN2671882.1 polyphenol oxidase family protein [Deltaproteobacteria bacterium]
MVDILKSVMLTEAGVVHGFTTGTDFSTAAGFSALKETLQPTQPIYKMKQVHGNKVLVTSEMPPSEWTEAAELEGDAVIADTAAVAGVVTADCVPILVSCKQSGLVAAVHAGWRGLKAGIVRQTIKAMMHRGASIGGMVCAIGPCICLNCYEVSKDVADLFPESSDPIKGSKDKYLLDLALAAEVSLIGVGLSSVQIDKLEICTSCGTEALFSYRKSGGDCGRQYAFICK